MISFKKIAASLRLTICTSESRGHQIALETDQLDLLVDAEPRILGDVSSWALYEDHFQFYGAKGRVPTPLSQDGVGEIPLIYCPKAFDRDNKGIHQHLEERGYFFRDPNRVGFLHVCEGFL